MSELLLSFHVQDEEYQCSPWMKETTFAPYNVSEFEKKKKKDAE